MLGQCRDANKALVEARGFIRADRNLNRVRRVMSSAFASKPPGTETAHIADRFRCDADDH